MEYQYSLQRKDKSGKWKRVMWVKHKNYPCCSTNERVV